MGEYSNIQSYCAYSKANFCKDDVIQNNENYFQKFDLILTDKDRSLPIIYWLPKLHKAPIGAEADLGGGTRGDAFCIFSNHLLFCNHFEEMQTVLLEVELIINNAP